MTRGKTGGAPQPPQPEGIWTKIGSAATALGLIATVIIFLVTECSNSSILQTPSYSPTKSPSQAPQASRPTVAPPITPTVTQEIVPPILRNQELRLVVGELWDIDKWFSPGYTLNHEIQTSDEGTLLVLNNGNAKAALMSGSTPDYQACVGATNYSSATVTMRVGQYFCMQTSEGRYAVLRVDKLPERGAEVPENKFFITLWDKP